MKKKVNSSRINTCTILIKAEKFKPARWDLPLPSQDDLALRLSALTEPVPRDEITEGENSRGDQNKVNSWCTLKLLLCEMMGSSIHHPWILLVFLTHQWQSCFPSGTYTPSQHHKGRLGQCLLFSHLEFLLTQHHKQGIFVHLNFFSYIFLKSNNQNHKQFYTGKCSASRFIFITWLMVGPTNAVSWELTQGSWQ